MSKATSRRKVSVNALCTFPRYATIAGAACLRRLRGFVKIVGEGAGAGFFKVLLVHRAAAFAHGLTYCTYASVNVFRYRRLRHVESRLGLLTERSQVIPSLTMASRWCSSHPVTRTSDRQAVVDRLSASACVSRYYFEPSETSAAPPTYLHALETAWLRCVHKAAHYWPISTPGHGKTRERGTYVRNRLRGLMVALILNPKSF
jgi:hypothetical protein